MKDFIQKIDNLQDAEETIVNENYEKLSETCATMKQEIQDNNKHFNEEQVTEEVQNVVEFALLAFAGDNVGSINNNNNNMGDDGDSRKKKKRKVTKTSEENDNIMNWLPGLFSLALKCAIGQKVAGKAPFVLLDSVLNTQTITVCEQIWDLVESLSETISHESLVPTDGRNIKSKLWLLRLANSLLKRLSTTQNSLFCGRISLFLARIFPLSEKSALNLTKKRNVSNTTVYDSEEVFNNEVDNSNNSNETTTKISYSSYANFWNLQQEFFRDPTEILKGPTPRRRFLQAVDDVLELFGDHSLPREKDGGNKSSNNNNNNNSMTMMAVENDEDDMDTFSAVKYLTTARLFRLQVIDPQLRRHVFCQILIILEELRFSGTSIKKSEMEKIAKCRQHVLNLLASITPNGKAFADGVFETLKSCVKWKLWKYNKKCPKYERFSDPKDLEDRAKEKKKMNTAIAEAKNKALKKGSKDAITQRRAKAGTTVQPALKKFWEDSKDGENDFNLVTHCKPNEEIQDLKQWYEPVIDAEDPENGIEDLYHPRHDKVYSWKSLRLTASKQFNTFKDLKGGSIVNAAENLGYIERKKVEEKEKDEEEEQEEEDKEKDEAEEEKKEEAEEEKKDDDAVVENNEEKKKKDDETEEKMDVEE